MSRWPVEITVETRSEARYLGVRTDGRQAVYLDDGEDLLPLTLSGEIAAECEWGRTGIGPRELARAVLLNATGNEMLAERLCRQFTWEVVSHWPDDGFEIDRSEVEEWISSPPIRRVATVC